MAAIVCTEQRKMKGEVYCGSVKDKQFCANWGDTF